MYIITRNFISRSTAVKLAYAGAAITVVFILILIAERFGFRVPDVATTLIFLSALTLFMISILIYAGAYLEVFGKDLPKTQNDVDKRMEAMEKNIDEINLAISKIPEPKTDVQIDRIVTSVFESKIKSSIKESLGENVGEIAKSALLSEYAPNIYLNKSFENVISIAEKYVKGLHDQITNQQRNANFNVYSGMAFALFGMFAMGIFIWQYYLVPQNEIYDWKLFILSFVPKITFVLIFESIAFFFLKTYRDDRSMVRYLRNESTNMEAKIIGISSSILFGKPATIASSIDALMKTERNFILKPKERTIIESLEKNDPILIEAMIEKIVPSVVKNLKERDHVSPLPS